MSHEEPLLVDAHTHVVSPDTLQYPLDPRPLSGTWYLDGPASAEDLAAAMTENGVGQAILVQGVGAYTYDNRYAADAARSNPARFVSACCIDVLAEDSVSILDDWILNRGMQGLRLFAISREGPSWLADESTFALWDRATEIGAHIIVTVLPNQLSELESVLERFPETSISLDHCAFALADPESTARLFELAVFPNLYLKVSTHNLDDAVAREGSARPLVGQLVDQFGAHRLMWGSDYCQMQGRTYGELVALGRDAFASLDPSDRNACLSGTARSLWPDLAAGAGEAGKD